MESNKATNKPSYKPLDTAPVQQATIHPPRDFHGDFCCCFGDCDGPGWIGCLFGTCCPCIAIGQNLRRATGSVGLGLLVGLVYLALMSAYYAIGSFGGTCVEVECTGDEYCLTKMECTGNGNVVIGIWAIFTIITLFGFLTRRHIRRVLKMDGRDMAWVDDFCSWYWGCGLCQETRTMIINRVEDGIWRGPENMQIVTVTAPPQTSTMATGSAV